MEKALAAAYNRNISVTNTHIFVVERRSTTTRKRVLLAFAVIILVLVGISLLENLCDPFCLVIFRPVGYALDSEITKTELECFRVN